MTRINANIQPARLCDQHLLAEHREIKRIPNTIKSGKAVIKNIPSDFRLGAGHVKFFYDKLGFLQKRYVSLYEECVKRGFNVTNYEECFECLPKELLGTYDFTDLDNDLVKERIKERLEGMKSIKYFSLTIDSQTAYNNLIH